MELQLRELLTHYGDVALIWFDGLYHQEKYDGVRMARAIHELQPRTLINNRIGIPGDFETPEQFLPKTIPMKGHQLDFNHHEAGSKPGEVPAPEDFRLWETCMTINNTWAYNKNPDGAHGHAVRTGHGCERLPVIGGGHRRRLFPGRETGFGARVCAARRGARRRCSPLPSADSWCSSARGGWCSRFRVGRGRSGRGAQDAARDTRRRTALSCRPACGDEGDRRQRCGTDCS